jgi:hypothetical protein
MCVFKKPQMKRYDMYKTHPYIAIYNKKKTKPSCQNLVNLCVKKIPNKERKTDWKELRRAVYMLARIQIGSWLWRAKTKQYKTEIERQSTNKLEEKDKQEMD